MQKGCLLAASLFLSFGSVSMFGLLLPITHLALWHTWAAIASRTRHGCNGIAEPCCNFGKCR